MNRSPTPMQIFLRHLKTQQNDMVGLLERFVKFESPSHDKAAVDAFGRIVAEQWKQRGAKVQLFRQPKRGNQIRAEMWLGEGRRRGQIMILGHLDTVYPAGTLARMPFRMAHGRAYG